MDDWRDIARQTRHDIAERALPFWFDHAYRGSEFGYTLGYDARGGPAPETEKLLVSQARLAWVFSRAARLGYSTPARDYLAAARDGLDYLHRVLLDRERGAYCLRARGAQVIDRRLSLYANCFVLYALAEHALAGGGTVAAAHRLFQVLQEQFRDRECGGWFESVPAESADNAGRREPSFRKFGNTMLHLVEALCLLHEVSPGEHVARLLREALELTETWFYPPEPERAAEVCSQDGAPIRFPPLDRVNFGHLVEFAWLREWARQRLGLPAELARFAAHLNYVLRFGFDGARGGIYESAAPNARPVDRGKPWWPQCELIAALSWSLRENARADHLQALRLQLQWMRRWGRDPATTLPYTCVEEDGTPRNTMISHAWNAGYHDLRSRWMLIEAIDRRTV